MRLSNIAVTGLLAFIVGCGGSVTVGADGKLPPGQGSGKKAAGGVEVSKEAARDFEQALKVFEQHDKAFDWDEGKCKSVAGMFQKAGETQKSATAKSLPSAHYNAGLSFQRCGLDADARKEFQAALDAFAGFHRASAQLALYAYKEHKDIDKAIGQLWQIVQDAKFQNVEALVSVAALQMERGNDSSDSDGSNDLARALKNIQRALAIDDGYMPAFNQLAIYYMELAKKKARGGRGRRRGGLVVAGSEAVQGNRQMLDLASLVASQAVRKNPK